MFFIPPKPFKFQAELPRISRQLPSGAADSMNRFGSVWSATLGLLRAAVPGTQRDMVRLRLQRFGRKNLPFYRVVAADSKSPRNGKCLEYLGTYNPKANKHNEKIVTLNVEVCFSLLL